MAVRHFGRAGDQCMGDDFRANRTKRVFRFAVSEAAKRFPGVKEEIVRTLSFTQQCVQHATDDSSCFARRRHSATQDRAFSASTVSSKHLRRRPRAFQFVLLA